MRTLLHDIDRTQKDDNAFSGSPDSDLNAADFAGVAFLVFCKEIVDLFHQNVYLVVVDQITKLVQKLRIPDEKATSFDGFPVFSQGVQLDHD